MGNLILYFGNSSDIKKIVEKYETDYQARVIPIETVNRVSFLDKLKSVYGNQNISVKRCGENLAKYDTIILISELWFDKIPLPVIKFLEQQTGKIRKIIYVLYNKGHEDKEKEFDRMDSILNLRREKSYFVSIDGKNIHVRVYQ